jgi:hypothetical protein
MLKTTGAAAFFSGTVAVPAGAGAGSAFVDAV